MPDTIKATILGFSSLYPKAQALSFSVPFDDGIRIIGWDDVLSNDKIYYGDEIDLKFWKLLEMPFGASSSSDTPLTLQQNYLYKYYHKKKIFDVYDNHGVRIVHRTNIQTISDLNIDFSIHKSHQFWVIVEGELDGYVFMFPAILQKDRKPIDINNYINGGVQNIYIPDRVRPYLPDDPDIPEWNIKYLALYEDMQRWVNGSSGFNSYKYDEEIYRALSPKSGVDWAKNYPTNYFYMKKWHEFVANMIPDDISKVPPFDPTKCYEEGAYVRGNTEVTSFTLYQIMSSSCQTIVDGHCTVDPYSFTYVIKNTSKIFDIEIGKRYYVNDIVRTDVNGKHIYYLVKTEFVMTDWEIDIINTDKICTLMIEIKKFKRFTYFAEHIWLLYMQLAIGMYPELMPVERYDETQNNRPIYEPWLIWGFYNFVWSKHSEDDDDTITIPLFDLSPMFA